MREVDSRLETRRKELEGRERAVAVQGNRIALHLLFRQLNMAELANPDYEWATQLEDIPGRTDRILDAMIKRVESEYPGNYITSLFKNAGRCGRLVELVASDL